MCLEACMCNKSESIISQPTVRIAAMVLTILLLLLGSPGRASAQTGAIIFVTSLEDKISSTGGCSLQEAIYSANLNNNIAVESYNSSDHSPNYITTQCVPGSSIGSDIIVLPNGAKFQLSKIIDDAQNPFGPTATPLVTSNITIQAYGSTFQWTATTNSRLFAVGSTGTLTINDAYIKGFSAKGGDGQYGGGGGLGAGGSVYVHGGQILIQNCTFGDSGGIGGNGGGRGRRDRGGGGGAGGVWGA